MKVLDLFSGIGGFSLGLERAGPFETVGFVEIDPVCQAVLAKHWPHVPCSPDIRSREFVRGEADVIVGGFPCQDISYAGKRAGLAGERSGLFWEMVRAIRVVRPRVALVENVAAFATPREPPPEPSDDPQRSPRYIGADYGAEPGRAVYPEDRQRMAAADDKRARKAAKRLALRSATDQSEKDSVR